MSVVQLPPLTPKSAYSVLTSAESGLTLLITPKKKPNLDFTVAVHSLRRLHTYMDTEDYGKVGLLDHL